MTYRVYEELEIRDRKTQSPSTLDSALELPRVVLEMTSLTYVWPLLASGPRGDGHCVMFLPGFTAGDQSTLILRRYLSRLNYQTLPWKLGQNTGSYDLQDRLLDRFEQVLEEHPGKISLVGQSLGGIFARVLATQWPERVRQVITLSAPFASASPESTTALVGRLYRYVSGMSHDEMRDQMQEVPSGPLAMPSTSIYTKTDGVVHWSTCLEAEGEQTENIEVLGSHSGMGFNPLVLYVLADRLAQADGQWRPFERNIGCRGLMFPKPAALAG
ncbi:MAG: alpha/beta hydrolase-fold protein [Pseudomonadales bacterium]